MYCLSLLQLAEVEKQQILKQQQNQKNSKSIRELERINRVSFIIVVCLPLRCFKLNVFLF